MKKLVWDLEGDLVLPEQVTTVSGYPVFITSVDDGVLKVRYSKDGMSAVAPAGTIGAHWEDVHWEDEVPADPTPRTIRSMELYQYFQAFRYAEVTVRGLGPAFQNAVAFIDKEVAIRVAEALKGIK